MSLSRGLVILLYKRMSRSGGGGNLFGLSLSATRDGEAWAELLREGEALGRLGKIRAYDKERRRKAKRALSSARRECAEAIERFDEFEAAMDTLRGALECVDLETGELHRPEHVQALIDCRKKEDSAASRQRRFFSGRSAPPMRMQPRISPIACTTFAPTRGGTPVRRHPITA